MPFPSWSKIPSESTIEVLTNHFILQELKNPSAYIFCPTRNEEKALAFDAHLQGSKLALIQYKGVERFNNDGSVSVPINVRQHRTLRRKFSRSAHPYVFYCFSTYPNYKIMHNDFVTGAGFSAISESHVFFWRSLLFDAWELPLGSNRVKLLNDDTLIACVGKRPHPKPIRFFSGPAFVQGFVDCWLGELGNRFADQIEALEEGPQLGPRRVSVLRAQVDVRR